MSEAQHIPAEDDFLNVYLTAFLGVGVVITIQTADEPDECCSSD